MRPTTELMIELRKLQTLLNQGDERLPLLEAHDQFMTLSKKGDVCTYVRKCEQKFIEELLPKIAPLLLSICNRIKPDGI